jgi:hypothetical protein
VAAALEQEAASPRLKITEIFLDQGEAVFSGGPRCSCGSRAVRCAASTATPRMRSAAATGGRCTIPDGIRKHGTQYVCVTGD